MRSMFQSALAFNGDISGWDTGAVTSMGSMFSETRAFNGDISGWNTGAVTNMQSMFWDATAFNGDISGWNTGAVTNMQRMFQSALAFNGDISGWDTGAVTNMQSMFQQASSFNIALCSWDTSQVTLSIDILSDSPKLTLCDTNECFSSLCDANADCNNTVGGFECGCKVGYIGNGSTCTICEDGTYWTASMCVSCPPNTISMAGSSNITDCVCNIGYEGADGAACSACAVGLYKGVNGSGSCAACEAGRYLNETGGSVCLSCPANTHSTVGSDMITDCICDGGYAGPDGAACVACAAGLFKAINGSGSCSPCAAGTYLNVTAGSVCTGCPASTVSPAGSDEIIDCICNIGYEGGAGAACSECLAGFYKPANGSGSCLGCEAGKYLNVTAGSACLACPSDTHSLGMSDAVTDCICNIGYEGSDGSACRACGAGAYKGVNGSGSCAACEAGRYLNVSGGTVCLVCPSGTSSLAGSDAITDCICDVGYAGPDGAACVACAAGLFKAINGSGSCSPCAAGTYLNVTAGSVCTGCPASTVSPAGSDEIIDCICNIGYEGGAGAACSECLAGFYKPANGSGSCLGCEAGKYLNVTAGSACLACPSDTHSLGMSDAVTDCICNIGYEGSDGSACRACGAGAYKGVNGSGSCAACEAGRYLNVSGGTVCLVCPSGTSSLAGSDAITDCICDGGYAGPDGAACVACAAGLFKAINGSGSCSPCAAGTYLNVTAGSVCTGCPASTVSPAGSDEIIDCICNIGYEGGAGAACSECLAGFYKPANGSGSCLGCEAGKYLNVTAGSACLACPSDTHSLGMSDAVTDCICNIGYEGSDGSACRACGAGAYKGVNGSGSCAACEAGRYLNVSGGTVCLVCPSGTSSLAGSDAITDCICDGGYAGPDGAACVACAAGLFKAINGSGSCSPCAAGTYLNVTAGSVCTGCPASTVSPAGSDEIIDCICNIGYEGGAGAACSECLAGFYKPANGSGSCLGCEAGKYLNVTAGSACLACPSDTHSLGMSDAVTDCICNIGYEGSDGSACRACGAGAYKGVNGSGSCAACEVGRYLNVSGGTVCLVCPSGTSSLAGSDAITDCICVAGYWGQDGVLCEREGPPPICKVGTYWNTSMCVLCPPNTISMAGSFIITDCVCNIGYEGADGAACSACAVGLYKGVNGSGSCAACEAGRYLNETGGSVCLSCPANTHSTVGSDMITDCICVLGYTGQDGGPCQSDGPTPNEPLVITGSVSDRAVVAVIGILGETVATLAGAKQENFVTALAQHIGVDSVDVSILEVADSGAGGSSDMEVLVEVADRSGNWSLNLTAIAAKLQGGITSGRVESVLAVGGMPVQLSLLAGPSVFGDEEPVAITPSGSHSIMGCLAGYGYQRGQCSACMPGKFKAVNGSYPCVDCPAGSYTVGFGSTECLGDVSPLVCFESEVTFEQCLVDKLPVRGCAASFDAGAYILQVEPGSAPLAQVASSCSDFFSWLCPLFGGNAARHGDNLDCEFYCDFFSRALNHSLVSGCSTDDDCLRFDNRLDVRPSAASLCLEDARYAIVSSCSVPDSKQTSFLTAVDEFLDGSRQDCLQVRSKGVLQVRSLGRGPDSITDFHCYETTECDYACFASGFRIEHQGDKVIAASKYSGDCDCSMRGYFEGKIIYTHESATGTTVQATNALRDANITLEPFRALNQLRATVVSAVIGTCDYVLEMEEGALLGLPVKEPKSSSDEAALTLLGYADELSNPPLNPALLNLMSRRRAGAMPSHQMGNFPGVSGRRQVLQSVLPGTDLKNPFECPQEEDDCRFACMAMGFEAQSFGPALALTPLYTGVCDCSRVFASQLPDGRVGLLGDVKDEVAEIFYEFPGAFEPSFLPAASGHNASAPLVCRLKPWDGDVMVLDIGDVCSYRWRVTIGQLVGVSAVEADGRTVGGTRVGRAVAAQGAVLLVPIPAEGAPGSPSPEGECSPTTTSLEDCDYKCLTSGIAVLRNGSEIMGGSMDESCASVCPTLSGAIEGQRMEVGPWLFAAHPATGLVRYEYTRLEATCWGLLNVSGGFFLGMPRAPALGSAAGVGADGALETSSSASWTMTVEQARKTATGLTIIVSTALGVTVTTSVVQVVTASVTQQVAAATVLSATVGAVAASSTAGDGGGGAAIMMVQQTQFLAVVGRVGGSSAQPEAARALSDGLAWSNFHLPDLFNLFPSSSDDSESDSAARRAKAAKEGAEAAGGDESDEGERVTGLGCKAARESKRELGATILLCVLGMILVYFFREFVNRLIYWLVKRKTKDGVPEYEQTLPFLSWELQVFLLMFTGLAESAGEAVSSKCRSYEIAGFFVLLVLFLFVGVSFLFVSLAIRGRCIVWESVSFREGFNQMKAVIQESKGKSCLHRFRVIYEGWDTLNQRGSWEANKEKLLRFWVADARFLDRYGSIFDSSHGSNLAYIYSFWNLVMIIANMVILAAVFSEVVNATLILAICAADSALLVIVRPNTVWQLFLQDFYRASVNLAMLSTILSHLQGLVSAEWFSGIFVILSILSLLASMIESILRPVVRFIEQATQAMRLLCSWRVDVNLDAGAAVVVATSAYVVMEGDTGTKTAIMAAADRDESADESGLNGKQATSDGLSDQTNTMATRQAEDRCIVGSASHPMIYIQNWPVSGHQSTTWAALPSESRGALGMPAAPSHSLSPAFIGPHAGNARQTIQGLMAGDGGDRVPNRGGSV